MIKIKARTHYDSNLKYIIEYTIENKDKKDILNLIIEGTAEISISYYDKPFTITVNLKDHTIEKYEDFTKGLDISNDDKAIKAEAHLFVALENLIKSYLDTLPLNSKCKDISYLYTCAKKTFSNDSLRRVFKSNAINFIVLMDILGLEVEDNIQDNYIKLYNYVINRNIYRESDAHAILAHGVRVRFIRYIPSGNNNSVCDMSHLKRSYSPLYIVKDRFKISTLQTTGNSFYDSSNGLVLTPTGGDSINPIIGIIIEDYCGCPFVHFHFTPIFMYNLDPYPKQ